MISSVYCDKHGQQSGTECTFCVCEYVRNELRLAREAHQRELTQLKAQLANAERYKADADRSLGLMALTVEEQKRQLAAYRAALEYIEHAAHPHDKIRSVAREALSRQYGVVVGVATGDLGPCFLHPNGAKPDCLSCEHRQGHSSQSGIDESHQLGCAARYPHGACAGGCKATSDSCAHDWQVYGLGNLPVCKKCGDEKPSKACLLCLAASGGRCFEHNSKDGIK